MVSMVNSNAYRLKPSRPCPPRLPRPRFPLPLADCKVAAFVTLIDLDKPAM